MRCFGLKPLSMTMAVKRFTNNMSDSLKKTMVNALKWSAVDRTLQQGVQFVIGIVLARLLCPADYGLIGMIMIFAQIAYVMVESGLGSALVRTEECTSKHTNTVFFTNLAISAVMYVLLFFSAPYIALFFNQPALVNISRVMFTAILFNAFYIVPFNLCVKKMDYKTIAKVNLVSTLLSGASGIAMALCDFGVWALVTQQASYHAFRMLAFYALATWTPRIEYSLKVLKEYFSFSVHILGSSLLTVIFNNLYTFLIGKFYAIDKVGYYTQANKLNETVNFTFQAILNSTYSMFAKIHTEIERLVRVMRSLIQKVSVVNIPLSVFLIMAAGPIFNLLLGEKWMAAVPYFQIICLANIFTPLYFISLHAINAIGKSRSTFIIELIKRMMILLSVAVCLIYKTDITTMLYCYAACCWCSVLVAAISVKKNFSIRIITQIFDCKDGLCIALLIGTICHIADVAISNLYIEIVVQALLSIAVYAGYILCFRKELIQETKSLIKGNYE